MPGVSVVFGLVSRLAPVVMATATSFVGNIFKLGLGAITLGLIIVMVAMFIAVATGKLRKVGLLTGIRSYFSGDEDASILLKMIDVAFTYGTVLVLYNAMISSMFGVSIIDAMNYFFGALSNMLHALFK